jgi:hypothetical protein
MYKGLHLWALSQLIRPAAKRSADVAGTATQHKAAAQREAPALPPPPKENPRPWSFCTRPSGACETSALGFHEQDSEKGVEKEAGKEQRRGVLLSPQPIGGGFPACTNQHRHDLPPTHTVGAGGPN